MLSDGNKGARPQHKQILSDGEMMDDMILNLDEIEKAQSEEQKMDKLELNSRQEDARLSERSEESETQHH